MKNPVRALLAASQRLAAAMSWLVLTVFYFTVAAPFAIAVKLRSRSGRERRSTYWRRR